MKVGSKAQIEVSWKVNVYDNTKEKRENIAHKFAEKYGVPVENVKVIADVVTMDSKGNEISVTDDIIMNIQDPKFHQKLYKEYLNVNNVDGYDFDKIIEIDSEINAGIEWDKVEKFRRYSINWIRMNNFLSYGEDNFFDFSKLKGIVLLNGEPANQSGKTTLAIEAIKFALFGKTNKVATLDKIFNKFLPKATEASVECGLTIDGEEYIIRRVLSRPALTRRTEKSKVTQSVEYYKVCGDERSSLEDYNENYTGETPQQTNKIIKETIGREDDFDLIISVTERTIDDIIEKKATERGRILSRWIGLLPIEEKEAMAKEMFNQKIKPNLLSNRYSTESLKTEITAYNTQINVVEQEIEKYKGEISVLDEELRKLEEEKSNLTAAKQTIREDIASIDITTLNRTMLEITERGKGISAEIDGSNARVNEIGDVMFDMSEFESLCGTLTEKRTESARINEKYRANGANIVALEKSEYCPTCGRKYENVDNTEAIERLKKENETLIMTNNQINSEVARIEAEIEKMKNARAMFDERNRLMVRIGALTADRERLRNEYMTAKASLDEYNKNNEAIDRNNKIDMSLRTIEFNINSKRSAKETDISLIASHSRDIVSYKEEIDARKKYISEIEKENELVKNWKIYLELVGKNGISKMVLRNALPVINAKLADLMLDVCDFTVEVNITDKNDVVFNIVQDGVVDDVSCGSGYEMTTSAMALRSVLASVSTVPRCNCLVLDEIWGRVAKTNLEKMKGFVEKIAMDYDFIFQVSHLDEVKEWSDKIVTVRKKGRVSSISN